MIRVLRGTLEYEGAFKTALAMLLDRDYEAMHCEPGVFVIMRKGDAAVTVTHDWIDFEVDSSHASPDKTT